MLTKNSEWITKIYTPLGCLCNHKKVNNESFQLLLDKGADVNKEFKIKDNSCIIFYYKSFISTNILELVLKKWKKKCLKWVNGFWKKVKLYIRLVSLNV